LQKRIIFAEKIVMIVDLFIPCFVDQFYPQTALNMFKLMQKAGVEVKYNPEQTCCGRFAYNAGRFEEAKMIGDKFLADFPNDRPIVAPTASCVGYIKKHYGELFFNTSNHLNFRRMEKNIYELSDFLINVLHFDDFGARFPHKVTYHDSCSALRELGIGKEARQLLSKVKDLELIEMEQTDICCGSELSFTVNHEAISVGMAEHKVNNALNTKAEFIVSTDLSCLMHQNSYIINQNKPIKVIHIVDVLASGWDC
jgi:Fe-S oxidoreductase